MAKDKESETKSKKYFVAFILLGIGIIGFVRINYIKESGREEREREKSRLILLYQKGNNRESAISYFVWESRSGENRKAERRDKMGQAGGSIYVALFVRWDKVVFFLFRKGQKLASPLLYTLHSIA